MPFYGQKPILDRTAYGIYVSVWSVVAVNTVKKKLA